MEYLRTIVSEYICRSYMRWPPCITMASVTVGRIPWWCSVRAGMAQSKRLDWRIMFVSQGQTKLRKPHVARFVIRARSDGDITLRLFPSFHSRTPIELCKTFDCSRDPRRHSLDPLPFPSVHLERGSTTDIWTGVEHKRLNDFGSTGKLILPKKTGTRHIGLCTSAKYHSFEPFHHRSTRKCK